MKKLTSVLLVLTLVMALSVGAFAADYANEAAANAANVAAGTQITVAGVTYTAIDDAAQITDLTANYYLVKDITWPATNLGDFSGSFNGGYHVITLTGDAMFSIAGGPTSVVSNFTLIGAELFPAAEKFGCVAYETNGGTFKNIANNVSILGTQQYVGGLFGIVAAASTADFLTIENCVNYAFINTNQRVAGILGALDKIQNMKTVTFRNCVNHGEILADTTFYAAGILAVINVAACDVTVNFENCVNNGAVSALNSFVGGIFGGTYKPGIVPTMTFKNCTNNGAITTSVAQAAYGTGGIFGGHDQGSGIFTFENCVNNGAVTAGNDAGGIFGGASKVREGDTFTIAATNCVNTGVISTTTDKDSLAAIVAICKNIRKATVQTLTVKDCYSTIADLPIVDHLGTFNGLEDGEVVFTTFDVIDCEVIADASALATKAQANTTGLTYTVVEGAIRLANSCVFENGVCKDCGAPDPYNPTPTEMPSEGGDDTEETTTAAITTKPTATTTAPTTTAPAAEEEKGGCKGLAVGSVALISMITLAGAAVVSKKKD